MSRLLDILTSRFDPDITVVTLAGKIVMGADNLRIESLVQDLLRKNEKKVIFDLSSVQYIDSTGMGTLAHCFAKVMRAGGGFRIAGAAERVRDLFKVTRLDTVFAFYPTVLAAGEDFTVTPQPGQNPW